MSRLIYNPFMPNVDFASRMARGGGGGDSGGGGDDSPPTTVSGSYSKDKAAVNATTAAANE